MAESEIADIAFEADDPVRIELPVVAPGEAAGEAGAKILDLTRGCSRRIEPVRAINTHPRIGAEIETGPIPLRDRRRLVDRRLGRHVRGESGRGAKRDCR